MAYRTGWPARTQRDRSVEVHDPRVVGKLVLADADPPYGEAALVREDEPDGGGVWRELEHSRGADRLSRPDSRVERHRRRCAIGVECSPPGIDKGDRRVVLALRDAFRAAGDAQFHAPRLAGAGRGRLRV